MDSRRWGRLFSISSRSFKSSDFSLVSVVSMIYLVGLDGKSNGGVRQKTAELMRLELGAGKRNSNFSVHKFGHFRLIRIFTVRHGRFINNLTYINMKKLFTILFFALTMSGFAQINNEYYTYLNDRHTIYAKSGVIIYCSLTFLQYTKDIHNCQYYYTRVNVAVCNFRDEQYVKFSDCKVYKYNEWCGTSNPQANSVSFAGLKLKPLGSKEGSFVVETLSWFDVKDLGYSVSWETLDW